MKKLFIIIIASFMFLFLSTTVSYFLQFLIDLNSILVLIIGVGIAIVSLILGIIFRRTFIIKYVCIFLNSISLGFMMRSWYIYRSLSNPLWVLYLVDIALILYIVIFYLLSYIPHITKHYGWFCCTYFFVTLVIYILLIESIQTTFLSTFGLYLIIQIPIIIVLCIKCDGYNQLLSNFMKATFSVFIVALVILVIMSDGDFEVDGCGDSFDVENPTQKNKKDTAI